MPSIGLPNRFPSHKTPMALSLWGDSRTQFNFEDPPATTAQVRGGAQYWYFEGISRAVRLNKRYQMAVGGSLLFDVVDRMERNVPNSLGVRPSDVPPSIAGLLIGTNNFSSSSLTDSDLPRLYSELNRALDWLVNHGHIVFLTAEWPRGDTSAATLGVNQIPLMMKYRQYMLKINRENVYVIDPWLITADRPRTDLRPVEGFLATDGLHNSPGMALINGYLMAQVAEQQLALPKFNVAPASNADQYNATTFPGGCLNTNPMLVQGAGGTLGANAAGVVPEGYTLSTGSAAVTATGSFVTSTFEGVKRPAFRIVVTGTPTADATVVQLTLGSSVLAGKWAIGDVVFAGMEFKIADDHTNFYNPVVTLDTGNLDRRITAGRVITGYRGIPSPGNIGYEMTALTSEVAIPSSTTTIPCVFGCYAGDIGVAASFTVDIFSVFVRKVV